MALDGAQSIFGAKARRKETKCINGNLILVNFKVFLNQTFITAFGLLA